MWRDDSNALVAWLYTWIGRAWVAWSGLFLNGALIVTMDRVAGCAEPKRQHRIDKYGFVANSTTVLDRDDDGRYDDFVCEETISGVHPRSGYLFFLSAASLAVAVISADCSEVCELGRRFA